MAQADMMQSEPCSRGTQGDCSLCRCCGCDWRYISDPDPLCFARHQDAFERRQWPANRSSLQDRYGLSSWWFRAAIPASR